MLAVDCYRVVYLVDGTGEWGKQRTSRGKSCLKLVYHARRGPPVVHVRQITEIAIPHGVRGQQSVSLRGIRLVTRLDGQKEKGPVVPIVQFGNTHGTAEIKRHLRVAKV